MTKLSVNINKLATLRNSRGGNNPDLLQYAQDIERWGADGITVHPRPDERHIRYNDVRELGVILKTELNIEGNPKEDKFVQLVLDTQPAQVTLVPDAHGQLTSNHGWDTIAQQMFLREMCDLFTNNGIRASIFVDAVPKMVAAAKDCGADRVELYTERYAQMYLQDRESALRPFVIAANTASEQGLGLNAGHDLDMDNLAFFAKNIPGLLEVSIGHALVCDALRYGFENTVQLYQRQLRMATPGA